MKNCRIKAAFARPIKISGQIGPLLILNSNPVNTPSTRIVKNPRQ